jgi:hypothetical protein
MSRLTNHTVRAGVSAVGVAAVLMALASTAQSPDGFTQASFGGPLNIFSDKSPQSDVAIGAGAADTGELSAILNGPLPRASPASPYREAYEAGAGPLAVGAVPAADPAAGAPTVKQSLGLPPKPVVDAMGRVDCTGAVSCKTDPKTHVTTVTYPDGAVALVQQINDMTVVAYKTLAETLQDGVESILPGVQFPGAPSNAAPQPATKPSVVEATATQTAAPTVDPGPAPDISASTVRPRVGVTQAPPNSADGHSGSPSVPGSITLPALKPTGPIDVVRDAIGSVVNAVTGHSASQTKQPTETPAPSSTPESGTTSGTGTSGTSTSGTSDNKAPDGQNSASDSAP